MLDRSGVSLPWWLSLIDDTPTYGCQYTSLAVSPAGQPAISYYDYPHRALKFAEFNGSTWVITTVENDGIMGDSTSLAFLPNGQPAISYSDHTDRALKFATRTLLTSP